MNNIPTAEEFLQEHPLISHYYDDEQEWEVVPTEQVQQAMIEFAKLHVEAAKKEIAENSKIELSKNWVTKEQTIYPGEAISPITIKVNQDSILNSYPLDNIK